MLVADLDLPKALFRTASIGELEVGRDSIESIGFARHCRRNLCWR